MNKTQLLPLITTFSVTALIVLATLVIVLMRKQQTTLETFVAEGGYTASYDLQANKSSVSQGDEVVVDVLLTTSGQDFKASQVILDWNTEDYKFVNAEATLKNKDGQGGLFVHNYLQNTNNSSRNFALSTPSGDALFNIPANTKTPIFKVTFEALKDSPGSEIKLSNKPDDLSIYFQGQAENVNAVDQRMAQATSLRLQGTGSAEDNTQLMQTTALGSGDVCATNFTLTVLACGQPNCNNDTDCQNGLVCANNGYCSMPDYEQSCNSNPSTTSCCTQPPLACGEGTCDSDSDCGSGLSCAPSGYCSMPQYSDSCDHTNPSNNCCMAQATPTPIITPYPTPTVIPTINPTPTVTPTAYVYPTPTVTPTATAYVTPTPTVTPTVTPTATPKPGCYDSCQYSYECSGNMECLDGKCKNPECSEEGDCVCNTPTPPAIPELPRAGGLSPTLLFTLGGIILVGLGLLF